MLIQACARVGQLGRIASSGKVCVFYFNLGRYFIRKLMDTQTTYFSKRCMNMPNCSGFAGKHDVQKLQNISTGEFLFSSPIILSVVFDP